MRLIRSGGGCGCAAVQEAGRAVVGPPPGGAPSTLEAAGGQTGHDQVRFLPRSRESLYRVK